MLESNASCKILTGILQINRKKDLWKLKLKLLF